MVAMALRVQPKVCAVVASANKSETAARPAAARPVSKSANLAATTAAKTLVATSVAVALGKQPHTPRYALLSTAINGAALAGSPGQYVDCGAVG